MPKVSQQYRDDRRQHILSAARRCFLRDGFHATSMQDLFAEADLSSGAVYRYFASKDEMIIAIATEHLQDVAEMVHAVASQRPGTSVGELLGDVLGVVQAKHAHDGLGGLALPVWAEALRNPSMAAQFNELLRRMRVDIADVVRTHQGAGDLPADVPADAVATVLMAIVPGYILQLALLGPDAVDGAIDAVRALWPSPERAEV
jgi:TetR/AcrR family transcriptional regulator, transcriptional repressor of aconitase